MSTVICKACNEPIPQEELENYLEDEMPDLCMDCFIDVLYEEEAA